jgi:hypothetical protein
VNRLRKLFAFGSVFSGLSIILLVTALFCQFYSITKGSGEYAQTLFPYTKYVSYIVAAFAVTSVLGVGGLIAGRENKETDSLIVTVLPEELKGEKRKINKLRATGYSLYGIGLLIFIVGLVISYFDATNFLSTSLTSDKVQIVFLRSIIPWIVTAIVLWAIATLPVSFSYKREQSRLNN